MPSKRLIKDPVKYKTVLCTTWATTGQCPYNRKCQFAHGKDELRQRTAPSPPQPPQPGQPGQMPPMCLPVANGMAGSSAAFELMGLPMPTMGQWSTAPPAPPLPPAMPPSSSAAPQTSLLGMPPLPPGPPPSSILPQPSLAAPAVAAAAGQCPPQPPPSLPALRRLPALLPLMEAGAPAADSVAAPAVAPAPSMAPPLTVSTPCTPSLYADELACFAMKCHLADDEDSSSLLGKTDVAWEPLRCNEVTGKVEVPYSVDSPVEPTLGKVGRQVSYPTQVVRRAISFVFDDGPNSPVNVRRNNTAMAA